MIKNSLQKLKDNDKNFIIINGVEQISFKQFFLDVKQAVVELESFSIESRDRVGLLLENCYEWLVYDYAVAQIGAVIVALPATYTQYDFLKLQEQYKYRIIITKPDSDIVIHSFQDHEKVHDDDIYSYVFSSGTSNKSKGMIVSYKGVVQLIEDFNEVFNLFDYKGMLIFMPLYGFQQRLFLYAAIEYGLDVYLTEPLLILNVLIKRNVDVLIGPPSLYNTMVKSDLVLRSLNNPLLISGMASLSPETKAAFKSYKLHIHEVYGLTECGLVTVNKSTQTIQGVGKPMPNTEIKINEDSEILVKKSIPLTKGYFQVDYGMDSLITFDQWLYTGDRGYVDQQNNLHIIGRVNNILTLQSGHKIQPEVIESIFSSKEGIKHSLVFLNKAQNKLQLIINKTSTTIVDYDLELLIKQYNEEAEDSSRIDDYSIICEEFTVENNMLFPTLKLNRLKVKETFEEMQYGN